MAMFESGPFGGEEGEMAPAAVVSISAAVTDDHFVARQVAYQNAMRSAQSPRMTLGVPTRAALKIRRGDLVFEDVTMRTVDGYALTGASRVSVFAGFRGLQFKLPLDDNTNNQLTANLNATVNGQPLLGEAYKVRGAKTRIAADVRFVGVALSNYVPGDLRQSNAGVAVAVGGKISIVNTSGLQVRRGDLLGIWPPVDARGPHGRNPWDNPNGSGWGGGSPPWDAPHYPDDPDTTRADALQPQLRRFRPEDLNNIGIVVPTAGGGGFGVDGGEPSWDDSDGWFSERQGFSQTFVQNVRPLVASLRAVADAQKQLANTTPGSEPDLALAEAASLGAWKKNSELLYAQLEAHIETSRSSGPDPATASELAAAAQAANLVDASTPATAWVVPEAIKRYVRHVAAATSPPKQVAGKAPGATAEVLAREVDEVVGEGEQLQPAVRRFINSLDEGIAGDVVSEAGVAVQNTARDAVSRLGGKMPDSDEFMAAVDAYVASLSSVSKGTARNSGELRRGIRESLHKYIRLVRDAVHDVGEVVAIASRIAPGASTSSGATLSGHVRDFYFYTRERDMDVRNAVGAAGAIMEIITKNVGGGDRSVAAAKNALDDIFGELVGSSSATGAASAPLRQPAAVATEARAALRRYMEAASATTAGSAPKTAGRAGGASSQAGKESVAYVSRLSTSVAPSSGHLESGRQAASFSSGPGATASYSDQGLPIGTPFQIPPMLHSGQPLLYGAPAPQPSLAWYDVPLFRAVASAPPGALVEVVILH